MMTWLARKILLIARHRSVGMVLRRAIACAVFVTLASALVAQQNRTLIPVPFVGCNSDGQVGPIKAPKPRPVSIPVSRAIAEKLAVYESERGIDVLALRGWNCFGLYGSGGSTLIVSQDVLDSERLLGASRIKRSGSAIVLTSRDGDTSGRFAVAEVIARVFPAFQSFADEVTRGVDLPPFPAGPWPADVLKRIGRNIVEYKTPGDKDGLGTYGELQNNADPIDGVAILTGSEREYEMLLLSVRLPSNQRSVVPTIIHEFEREVLNQRASQRP